jgi:hypothetical protein
MSPDGGAASYLGEGNAVFDCAEGCCVDMAANDSCNCQNFASSVPCVMSAAAAPDDSGAGNKGRDRGGVRVTADTRVEACCCC